MADNRGVLKAVADTAASDEEVKRTYHEFMYSYWIDDLAARIKKAQESGLAKGLDPEVAGEALHQMAERMGTQSLDRDPDEVLDTIISLIAKCIYSG